MPPSPRSCRHSARPERGFADGITDIPISHTVCSTFSVLLSYSLGKHTSYASDILSTLPPSNFPVEAPTTLHCSLSRWYSERSVYLLASRFD
ncbi:hypothetical protein CPB86DRAFT_504278 [Serendipita vermifera]|nr:hypothetical protein CPB86DRAFT_504278 [Serendipita vermifera]